ncbi:hypothetical protein GCM10022252_18690 [Streptosporangium oxazolinicum]|uniref:Uncharacterized protein n=1 Tax=Streptosporangium oxazolinicum TaxID=909287 RepID=A0ABP8AN74_9ACTN
MVPLPFCTAIVELTQAQGEFLSSLPCAGLVVEPYMRCSLEAGHRGRHVTLAQGSSMTDWWATWGTEDIHGEFLVLPNCSITEPITEDACVLPAEHVGKHSFELV